MSEEEFEGRLNAHRELLVTLLAALLSEDQAGAVARIREETLFKNGQEDPGVLPGEAFAIESRMAEEIRRIAEAAALRAMRS